MALRMRKEDLAMFDAEIQKKILDVLKAYDKVTVSYEYGEYQVSTGACVKARYGEDHEVFGTWYAEDVYTLEERTENYIEMFQDYPIWYKGVRDYAALRARFNK